MGPEYAALAMLAIGTGTSAIAQIKQGNAAQRAGEFNAKVASNNAVSARAVGAENVERARRAARKAAGARNVAGQSLDVQEDNAIEEELEIQSLLFDSELVALGHTTTASLTRAEGGTRRRQGIIGGVSTALLGAGKIGIHAADTGTGTALKLSD